MKRAQTMWTQYIFALGCLVLGVVLGLSANMIFAAKSATPQEIEATKAEIAKTFQGKTVDACWRVNNGSSLATGKYELTYRNLRINKQLNRAIVTDCADIDTLLAKNKSGEWVATSVNLHLDNRVNPVWQKECQIEDITVADDTIRPENDTIDQLNLEACRQLR